MDTASASLCTMLCVGAEAMISSMKPLALAGRGHGCRRGFQKNFFRGLGVWDPGSTQNSYLIPALLVGYLFECGILDLGIVVSMVPAQGWFLEPLRSRALQTLF